MISEEAKKDIENALIIANQFDIEVTTIEGILGLMVTIVPPTKTFIELKQIVDNNEQEKEEYVQNIIDLYRL